MSINESTIKQQLRSFQQEFRSSSEPNQTLFDIIGRSTQEEDWQQLLAYFLRPAKGHGFGSEILESFLNTVETQTQISGLDGSPETVRVDVEVQTPSKRRVDLLLSQEDSWFLCIELKVRASEHQDQTVSYVEAEYIGTRAKSSFPDSGHHYLYLTPDQADQPTSEDFEHLDWSVLEENWRNVLEKHRSEDGTFPSRGVAQFAEFLVMIRSEAGSPLTEMERYYRDVASARRAYEELATSLATALEKGVQQKTDGRDPLRIRRKRRGFPQFDHGKYNRIEVDKPLWQAGRSKSTILFEFNFHLRPHLGPGETQQRPSVAINLDIRGGADLKTTLREKFKSRVEPDLYRQHGFGRPHTNTKWHFLTKEVLLDETDTPVSELLEAFDVLYQFEPVLDEIAVVS